MILMYHKIHPEVKSMWWVSPDAFYLQMLDLQNKKVVYLDDYDPSDPSHVAITFDGIYENVWKFGVPILKHFGYPFELFIVGDQLGKGNEFDTIEPPAQFADVETLKKIVDAGGRLQWHTATHPVLTGTQSPETYQHELSVPDALRALCPDGYKWFAYPHGKRDDSLKEQAKKHFDGALACDDGTPGEKYDLPRVTVVESTRFNSTRVSVIIPCYNYGHLVAEAIESVLLQSYPPEEILFIDDASTDNSVEVARRYESRIRVEVNTENLGIVENFKKAVQMTSGDYVCFLGADNRFRGDYIEKCKTILDRNADVGVVYTHFALFGNKASVEAARTNALPHPIAQDVFIRKFPENPTEDIRKRNYIHGSSMYRRAAYEQAGGYQQSHLPEDNSLFARMLDQGWKSQLWDEPSLEYRQHSKDQVNYLKGYETENVYLRTKVRELNGELGVRRGEAESFSWLIFRAMLRIEKIFVPKNSRREKLLQYLFRGLHLIRQHGLRSFVKKVIDRISERYREHKEKIDDEVPRVSIIIPVFNALAFTQKCIHSLFTVDSGVTFEVIVVDNGSTDGTLSWLKKQSKKYSDIRIFHFNQNLGFGAAVNQGAYHCRGEYVVILNNDTIVSSGWLKNLVAPMEKDPLLGIVSPITNYVGEGPQIDPNANHVSSDLAVIEDYARSISHRTDEFLYEPKRLVFFCVLIRRELFDWIGFLDEGYVKGNFEDDDYCLRARMAGYTLGIARNSFVYHHGSVTFKKNLISHNHYMFQNRERFYKKAGRISVSSRLERLNDPVERQTAQVSVLMRTQNREAKLKKALASLGNQTFKNFEVVLVNDGGEDISSLVDQYRLLFPINYIFNVSSEGRTAAINTAIQNATGEWLAFLDDDDIYYPWHLEVLLNFAVKRQAKFVYSNYNKVLFGDMNRVDPDKLVTPTPWAYNKQDLLIQNHIPIHTWFVSRSLALSAGRLDETLDRLEDYEYVLRLNKMCEFQHLNQVTCEYRYYLDSSNSIYTDRKKVLDALMHIYNRYPTSVNDISFGRKTVLDSVRIQMEEINKLSDVSGTQSQAAIRKIVRMVSRI